ncbi:MAG: rod-binding protein [Parvibaculaceae bacterium]|nr:rod-binding protein [Parvibaculaceae bacterium]
MQIDTLMANASLSQQTAQSVKSPLANSSNLGEDAALQAATDFEAQVLSILNQSMFAGIETDGYFGGGHGEEMFRSMLVEEYSGEMVKTGGLGLTDTIYRQILEMQEANS